jgi:GNAT superfamily N-acetyltransferase
MDVRPVTVERLADLADLFGTAKVTTNCWCMWFIDPAKVVQDRWDDGGNRRAFEARARAQSDGEPPLGLLAYADDGTPVGWLATGPRSRYARAIGPRTQILRDRDPDEDDDVWLLPCFFVRVGHRRRGVTAALLDAAVGAASAHGATAVEGFPIAAGRPVSADAYLGTEHRFADCGFECIARPSERRVVMRRNLTPT